MSHDHEMGPAQKFIRYEVRRERKNGRALVAESFLGLDRARLSALAHALDGPTESPHFFSGRVQVFKVIRCHSAFGQTFVETCLDDLNEAVASVFLNNDRLGIAR